MAQIILEKKKTTNKERKKDDKFYIAILHNDSYTYAEYVVLVLSEVFNKSYNDACKLMLEAHKTGKATIGLYEQSVAFEKREAVDKHNEAFGQELLITIDRYEE